MVLLEVLKTLEIFWRCENYKKKISVKFTFQNINNVHAKKMCRIWNIYMPWHYEEAHIPRSPLPLFVRFPYLFPAFSWLATYCISPASSTWYLRHIHPAKFARPENWCNKTLQNILFLLKSYFYLKQEPKTVFLTWLKLLSYLNEFFPSLIFCDFVPNLF